ncbi:MAG: hypothetical protein EBR23_01395 [Planctomycetia bacterium]|nr:hypothetical protein [Planctomycetia bacterium]
MAGKHFIFSHVAFLGRSASSVPPPQSSLGFSVSFGSVRSPPSRPFVPAPMISYAIVGREAIVTSENRPMKRRPRRACMVSERFC